MRNEPGEAARRAHPPLVSLPARANQSAPTECRAPVDGARRHGMLVAVYISTTLKSQGGVTSVATLRRLGATAAQIRQAVASGTLVRIRRGWLRTPDADPAVVRAVAAGGRLGCVSAAAHHGLWVPDHSEFHVSLPHHAGRHASQGLIAHWEGVRWRTRRSPIESIADVVRQIILCCDYDDAVAVIDSALHQRRLSIDRLQQIVSALPEQYRRIVSDVDARSESGLESVCRVRLTRLGIGIGIRPQVELAGLGRVDLLVGDRLIVETDGREWHEGPDAFFTDRARDLVAHKQGYLTVRLAPNHVTDEWPWVELVIASIIDRGEHLWSARQRRWRSNNSYGG